MEGGAVKEEEQLPPGFRFHPTDEELITHYLTNKITEADFGARAIADVDLNKCEPWDLPDTAINPPSLSTGKAKMGEKEWYFFSLRDRKYPTGVRTNRATNAGYWKTTGKDKEIFNSDTSELVGMKKTLVFYKGRAPRGEKTNWVMHEYRLHSKSALRGNKDEWVVCRVFMKSSGGKKCATHQPRLNPYHVPMIPSLVQNDPFHFGAARSYLSNAELMELSRFSRGAHGFNLPIQPQFNLPGGAFTLAGLNLNLGAPTPPPLQTALRTMTVPLTQPLGVAEPPSSELANGVIGAMGEGFSTDVNSTIAGTRYHNVDSCMELEGYWPAY
ncbi:unnamed protein product [Musa banksii]